MLIGIKDVYYGINRDGSVDDYLWKRHYQVRLVLRIFGYFIIKYNLKGNK